MGIVTVEDLTQAIKNSIDDSHAMVEEQAYELAHHVLNFFGYSDRIIDNVLEPEDRDAFYMLEDAGILTTEREETTLYDNIVGKYGVQVTNVLKKLADKDIQTHAISLPSPMYS